METPNFEERFETYLQGHIHPDVQPQARRMVRVGQVSMEGFLEAASVFQANHEALDAQIEASAGFDAQGTYIERTQLAQQEFSNRIDS